MLMENKHMAKFNLEANFAIRQKWFCENQKMLLYVDKQSWPDKINLNATELTSDNNEIQLVVFVDKKLSFDLHINSLCKKAGQKHSALAKISSYLTLDQKLLLINSVMMSQLVTALSCGCFVHVP